MSENKTVYSYSYKLYQSDIDNSKTPSIDLPNNINTADFVNMIKLKNLSKTSKIQITRTKQNTAVKETLTLYVDDRIKTAGEIQDILKKKYGSVCGFTPQHKQSAPTVITGHIIRHRYGMTGGYNVRIDRNTVIFKEAKEVTWDEPEANVESPKPEHDVIVNRELNQIWPVATGALPKAIQEFFINER